MDVLLSLLGANVKLLEHAARTLERATERQPGPKAKPPAYDEQAFVQAYLALREVETRALALLHQTARLAQALRHEAATRQKEQKLAQNRSNIAKYAQEIINSFLAEHEALVRAAARFQAFDPALALLQPDADSAVLKTFATAENSEQQLREAALAEAQGDRPRQLADALETRRGQMRQQMTRLSNARRHFTTFVYQHIPAGDTL